MEYLLDDRVWKEHEAAVKELVQTEIAVGVLGKSGSELVNIAYWLHEGTRKNGNIHIPPRPYFTITMTMGMREIQDAEDLALQRILSGKPVQASLALFGAYLAAEVQKTMVKIDEPANAPSTVDKKGFDNPLIHIGRLKGAITYTVRTV